MAMSTSWTRYHDPRQLWIREVQALPLDSYSILWVGGLVQTVTKAPGVPVVTLSLLDWHPRKPWGLGGRERVERGVFKCIGCEGETRKKHTYCKRCARLVAKGIPLDAYDLPTWAEVKSTWRPRGSTRDRRSSR
jgi:hypothetical protein